MGFFAEFNTWLNGILTGYVGDNTARMAHALEPAIVAMGTIYVMIWGYLHLFGKIQEPLISGMKRIAMLTLILGVAVHLWLYNTLIVDTFFNAPSQLAASIIGAYDSVSVIDQVIFSGGDAASLLLQKGSVFGGNLSYYLGGMAVYLIVGLTAIYAIFLLTLSRIALSVLLTLGPLFIALLFFDSTKRFFESWLAQLCNYALITVLTTLVAALMMALIRAAAGQAASAGQGIEIAHAVRVCMAAGLTFLVMRQVMPMAASLASGLALSSFGIVSQGLSWAFGTGTRSVGQFARGALFDRDTSRWDSLSRKSGYLLGHGAKGGVARLAANWRDNSVAAR